VIPVQRPHLGAEELAAVGRVFDSRWLGMGSITKEFEEALRPHVGAKHVVAVNTGTSALHIALDALGLESGDEVIVPSLTFVAAVQAIVATGATPVFCEVDPETLNIDVGDAAARITDSTRVIMPVHYGGEVCDMDAVMELARDHRLKVVDDAAHAFGSSYKGRPVGSLADVTCFSFDPIKNITCGEGGAVTTNDAELAALIVTKRILGIDNDTLSRYRNQRNWVYQVTTTGWRYHMSNINAAIGLEQLKRMEQYRQRKVSIVETYDAAFGARPGLALIRHRLDESFPFFYILRVLGGRRDAFIAHLKEHNIGSGVHYIPNHLQPLFASSRVSLPQTESLYNEIVTLPMYFEMNDADVDAVVEVVSSFSADGGA
jgi:perosamine synthetase